MKSPTRWAILLAVFFIGFLIPELNGYFSGTYTLSQAVWLWNDTWVVVSLVAAFTITFGFGVLIGHLFVPRRVRMLVESTYGDERSLVLEERALASAERPVELFADSKDIKAFEESTREMKRRAF